MKLVQSLALGLAAALTLAACGTSATGTPNGPDAENELPPGVSVRDDGAWMLDRNAPVTGGTLTIGLETPVEILDPVIHATGATPHVYGAIYDRLLTMDNKGNMQPGLAESLTPDDDTGYTWTMKLKSGIKFHDGTPFNAAAVAAHFQRVASPDLPSASASLARNMVELESPDELTLHITLGTPTMALPAVISDYGVLGNVPSPTAVAELGADFGFKPVGAGPFKIVSFSSGGDIVLEKNQDYYVDDRPYLDGLRFVVATDNQARLMAATTGDIDMAISMSGKDLRDAQEKNGLTSLYHPAPTYFNLLLNISRPPFDDVRIREALHRAINLDAINEAVFEGLNTVMTGIFPSDNPFFKDTDWPSFDPDRARELVEEYEADTGLKAEFVLTTTSPPEFQQQSSIMQQMLADVGITANLIVGDQPTNISEALQGTYQAQHRYTSFRPDVVVGMMNQFLTGSTANISHGGNAKLDKLMKEGLLLIDEKDRAKNYAAIQDELRNWLPYMPQIRHTTGWYVGDKVGGFPGAVPGNQFIDVSQLYIAAADG